MSVKNLQILLADDEAEISALVASVLRRSGHSVDLAGDGQAALELLQEKPGHYQLLITDSNMPLLSGIDLVRKLREEGFPGKIILLSGYVADDEDEIYKDLNIDRVLQKPFSFTALTQAVNETAGV